MAQRRADALRSHLRPAAEGAAPAAARGGGAVPEHWRLSQVPAGPVGPRATLTDAEKRQLYRDGFLILRGAVPRELTERARKLYNMSSARDRGGVNATGSKIGNRPEITDLITKSCVAELLRNEMGPFSPPVGGMVAVTPPTRYNAPDELPPQARPLNPWPEYGYPGLHIDGFWSGVIPTKRSELDVERGMPKNPAKYFKDQSPTLLGTNFHPLWEDKEKTLSLGSFTTFVFVAINDQTQPRRGQTHVIRGAHHHVQNFFREQVGKGGIVGPEGPGWPRLVPIGDDGVMINPLPESVLNKLPDGARHAGGRVWPEPTPVLMAEGDCCITLHACPHGASINFGPDPRMNIIFRIRRAREGDPNEGSRRQGCGTSDHPDRGFYGQFLEYPPGYDPFKLSIGKLCDFWSDWRGMQHIVAEELEKEGRTAEEQKAREAAARAVAAR